METTCQASYPLNSANASPFGTVTAYLSCAHTTHPPAAARIPAVIIVASVLFLLMLLRPFVCLLGRQSATTRHAHAAAAVNPVASLPVRQGRCGEGGPRQCSIQA